jgi:acetyl esterase/lipase
MSSVPINVMGVTNNGKLRGASMSYVFDRELRSAVAKAPVIDLTDIPALRGELDGSPGLPDFVPHAGVRVRTLSPTEGGLPVQVIVVDREDREGPRPLLLWFHGGGFVLGDARESLPFLDATVRATDVIAVSVQYDLAPEAAYPTPLDQGVEVLAWLIENALELGVDSGRILVGGQSAGGAHAASLTLRLRDLGGPNVEFLLLDIPVLDEAASTESASEYSDTPVWHTANVRNSWTAYLGDVEDPITPANSGDLRGLPPTFIAVNQFDPLRDEGIEYARRLAHAGVQTELHLYPGTFHGSASLVPGAAVSRRQNRDMIDALCRAVEAG